MLRTSTAAVNVTPSSRAIKGKNNHFRTIFYQKQITEFFVSVQILKKNVKVEIILLYIQKEMM